MVAQNDVWWCVRMGLFLLMSPLAKVVHSLDRTIPPQRPHIVLVLADDLGWGDVGFHTDRQVIESRTPTMDRLVDEGIELRRHYVHYMCTPTRASLQSGRLPAHLLLELADPCDRNGAIPAAMTGVAEKLKGVGYATAQVGKWDAGMATPKHTPQGRGYDSSLTYFGHGNWAWTQAEWGGSQTNATELPDLDGSVVDFWDTDGPADALNGTDHEELLFRERFLNVVENARENEPLFLFYASKLAHMPLQTPPFFSSSSSYFTTQTRTSSSSSSSSSSSLWDDDDANGTQNNETTLQRQHLVLQENRRVYLSMVAFLDEQLAVLVDALERRGFWNDTLLILSSDNGGYVEGARGPCVTSWTNPDGGPAAEAGHGTACVNGEMGASNFPLRGGKYSPFEGGIRSVAFVSGGFVPPRRRGARVDAPVHVADWYATLCGLAGCDPRDDAPGVPPIDSVDVWPLLVGDASDSPRRNFLVDAHVYVSGPWKYIAPNASLHADALAGPVYPNRTSVLNPLTSHTGTCLGARGCLFHVVDDPSESTDRADDVDPDFLAGLRAEMDAAVATIYTVDHSIDPACLDAAWSLYGGFYGPWKNLSTSSIHLV